MFFRPAIIMKFKDIHIYTTPECNLGCTYCFRDYWKNHSEENLIEIANILAGNADRVVLGGGEPTTVSNITDVAKILKDSGVYTEMHTNAMKLNHKFLKKINPVLDSIAIPIDSLDPDVQRDMKGADYVPIFKKVVKDLEKYDLNLKYHSVAAYPNIDTIPKIYDFIKKTDFDSWRIYLFNFYLAVDSMFKRNFYGQYQEKYTDLEKLEGPSTPKKGHTDSLFAKYLLLEEEMEKLKDKRIEFADTFEHEELYVFINSTGDVTASQNKIKVGNILEEGFDGIVKRLENGYVQDCICEKGNEMVVAQLPLFARLVDFVGGFYIEEEEIEIVEDKYWDLFNHLSDLYVKKYPSGAPIC